MPRGKKKGTPVRSEADKTPPPSGEPAKKKGSRKANKKAAQKIIDDDRKGGTVKRTDEYQEDPDKKSKDKETVKVDVACPCCGETITVRVFKEITQKAISAEYRLYGIAEKDPQVQLDLGMEPSKDKGTTATAEPGGGREKAS